MNAEYALIRLEPITAAPASVVMRLSSERGWVALTSVYGTRVLVHFDRDSTVLDSSFAPGVDWTGDARLMMESLNWNLIARDNGIPPDSIVAMTFGGGDMNEHEYLDDVLVWRGRDVRALPLRQRVALAVEAQRTSGRLPFKMLKIALLQGPLDDSVRSRIGQGRLYLRRDASAYGARGALLLSLPSLPSEDPLTGVLDGSSIATLRPEAPLVLVDLLHFNDRVNWPLGISVGDRVLHEVGTRLREGLAPLRVFRSGGDDFLVEAGETLDEPGAEALAHRIAALLALPIDGLGQPLEARIGVVLGPVGDDWQKAKMLAGRAAYEALRRGVLMATAERSGGVSEIRMARSGEGPEYPSTPDEVFALIEEGERTGVWPGGIRWDSLHTLCKVNAQNLYGSAEGDDWYRAESRVRRHFPW